MKETTEALYKHQSETKNKISKEINELRMKMYNIKGSDLGYGKPQKKD
jgi:hypothetical protein